MVASILMTAGPGRKRLPPHHQHTRHPYNAPQTRCVACNSTSTTSVCTSPTAPGSDVLGKKLSVYWPADDAWYSGTVTDHNLSNGQHLVKYDDGEEEWVLLAHERVRWDPSNDQPTNNKGVC